MKRLMVMLSAVAVGFGLFATDDGFVAGTGFESDTVGPFAPESGWTIPTGDANQALTVTAYGAEEAPTIERPAQYDGADNAKFLDVKTSFGKPVELNVSDATMGGIYFDSLVKFTACDEAPSADSYTDAKLIVYTLEDAEGGQKIFVRAGKFGSDGVEAFDYDCGTWEKGDAWVRLTIKTIGNVAAEGTVPAFVVFVDGQPLSSNKETYPRGVTSLNNIGNYWNDYNSTCCYFPSLIQGGATLSKIAAAGFDGQGKIDDLSFTTTSPDFAADPAFFTVTWNDKVVVTSYQVNGGTPVPLTDAQKTAMTVAIPYIGAATVTVEAAPAEGCVIKKVTAADGATWDGDVFTIAADATAPTAVIEGANATPVANIVMEGADPIVCYSFEDAIDKINDGEIVTKAAKLALVDDVVLTCDKDGMTKAFASEFPITLDLAGKTITAAEGTLSHVIRSYGKLTIDDSSTEKSGKIIAVENCAGAIGAFANAEGDGVTILAGTYDGLVYVDAGDEEQGYPAATLVIAGESKFSAANSTEDNKFLYAGNVADGFQAADALDADNYWVVAEWVPTSWDDVLDAPVDGAYQIDNEDDLIALATYAGTIGTEGITFKQTDDIDLDGVEWAGIGAGNNKDNLGKDAYISGAFQGTYDGGSFTVSNITLVKADYTGFFGSLYGATVKNLKLSSKDTGFGTTGNQAEWAGALAVGVSVKSTIEKVETLKGSFKTQKAGAGIVGYAGGGTILKDCVNRLDVTSIGNEKVAGLVGCAQNTGTYSPAYVTIDGCSNFGNVECQASGKSRAALLVSYTDCEVWFQGNITAEGTVTQAGSTSNIQSIININGGSAKVVEGAAITAPAGLKSTIHNGKAHAGLNYAMVADNVATFVADSAAAVNGANLKVMTTGNTITLANVGDSITLDTSLATATVETTAENAEVKQEGNVYTVVSTKPPVDPVDPEEPKEYKDEEAAKAAAKEINEHKADLINVPTGVQGDAKTAYLGMFEAVAEGKVVTVQLTAKAEEDLQKQVDADTITKVMPAKIADGTATKATLTTTPGFYYTVIAGNGIGTMEPKSSTLATGAELTVDTPKFPGAGFYKIQVSVKPVEIPVGE